MACELCEKRGKPWEGSDPKCGFPDGQFSTNNWNCATLNTLRHLAEEHRAEGEDFGTYRYRHCDVSFAALPFTDSEGSERFIALSWYKDRGRTGQAWVFQEDDPPQPLSLAQAMDCIRDYEKGKAA